MKARTKITFFDENDNKFFGEGQKVLLDIKGLLNRKEYEDAGEFIRVGIKVTFSGTYFVRTLHLLSSYNAERYIEKLGTIKTYKKYKQERHYTSKKVKAFSSIHIL